MISNDIAIVLPEVSLAVYAMLALLIGVYGGKDKTAPMMMWLTAGVFVALAIWTGTMPQGREVAFNGMFVSDGFARFAKMVILLSAAVVLVMGQGYLARRDLLRFEYPLLIALAVVGMMMMVSAHDLMALYMGLELQSLALYVVAAMRRDSVQSTEAGLKYFVLGALSSGLLLYGASLLYGYTGTTQFAGILEVSTQGPISIGMLIGLVFVLSGLAFKVSAAPFHMWTPDVYEGAPTPITAFFATAPKMAAMALMARVIFDAFAGAMQDWQQVIAALSVASMFVGSIAAIGQKNIKRLMAYSSIAHMGFAMMGLAAGTVAGVQAMLIYMAIYVTMNIGSFAFILMMERDGRQITEISALNQYARYAPARAIAVLLLMFSLAGIPPLVGFFAKYNVFLVAVDAGLTWLVVAAAIASAIGAFYYLRIVYLMYFAQEAEPLNPAPSLTLRVVLMVAAVAMIVGSVNLFGIEGMTLIAAEALVN